MNRDLYFMNLGYVDSDSELFQAFATVPPNSIIVFEDVDTMTDVSQAQSLFFQRPLMHWMIGIA